MFRCAFAITMVISSTIGLSQRSKFISEEQASEVIGGDIACNKTIAQLLCQALGDNPAGGCDIVDFNQATCGGDCELNWYCEGVNDIGQCVGAGIVLDLIECEEDEPVPCGFKRLGVGNCTRFFEPNDIGQLFFLGCVCPNIIPTFDACNVMTAGTTDDACSTIILAQSKRNGAAFQLPTGEFRVFSTLGSL